MSLNIAAFSVAPLPPTETGVLSYAIDVLVNENGGRTLIDRRGKHPLVFPFCLTLLPPTVRRQFVLRACQLFVEHLGRETAARKQPVTADTEVPAAGPAQAAPTAVLGASPLTPPALSDTSEIRVGDLYWVSTAQLAADAVALASKLPLDTAGVVGLPRSGMIPASIIAALLHLPLYELTSDGRLNRLGHGSRGSILGFRHPAPVGQDPGPLAVIDDTVYSGWAMSRARESMARLGHRAVFAAVYSRLDAVPGSESAADIYGRALPSPHLLEWNMANNGPFAGQCGDTGRRYFRAGCALDLDGIVLHDAESGGAVGAPYMVPRSIAAKLIVTGRREKYRAVTESQLRAAGVLWERLEMLPDDAPDESPQTIARHKARHYGESDCGFYFESDPVQAELIHHHSGRPVVCPRAGRVWHAGDPAEPPEPLLPDSAVAPIFGPLAGKRVALVHSPATGNTGDRLIERAAEQLLDRFGVAYEVCEPDAPGDCDVVLLFGGGNYGHHRCPIEADRRRRALATGKPCVLLPQTAYGPEPGTYAAAFVRDARSLGLVPGSTLAPDLALCYRPERPPPPPVHQKGEFFIDHDEGLFRGRGTDPRNTFRDPRDYLDFVASHAEIHTDSLHVAIAGLIARRSVTLYPTALPKNKGAYDAWLARLGCRWADARPPLSVHYDTTPFAPKLSPAERQKVYRLLDQVGRALDDVGVSHVLHAGSLLGFVRYGALLPWDDDADLLLIDPPGDLVERLRRALPGLRFDASAANARVCDPTDPVPDGSHSPLPFPAIDLDLRGRLRGDHVEADDPVYRPGRRFLAADVLPSRPARFGPVSVRVPANPVACVTLNYGAECLSGATPPGWCHRFQRAIQAPRVRVPLDALPRPPVEESGRTVAARPMSVHYDTTPFAAALTADERHALDQLTVRVSGAVADMGLSCVLYAGGLLGLARYGRPLPWDDDEDLLVLDPWPADGVARLRELLPDLRVDDDGRIARVCDPADPVPAGSAAPLPFPAVDLIHDAYREGDDLVVPHPTGGALRFPVADVLPVRVAAYGAIRVPVPQRPENVALSHYGAECLTGAAPPSWSHRLHRPTGHPRVRVPLVAIDAPIGPPQPLDWRDLSERLTEFVGAVRSMPAGPNGLGIACDPNRPGQAIAVCGSPEDARDDVTNRIRSAGVRVRELHMLTPATPRVVAVTGDVAARIKADRFRESGLAYFVESCPRQAALIHRWTGGPVVCPQIQTVFCAGLDRLTHLKYVPRCGFPHQDKEPELSRNSVGGLLDMIAHVSAATPVRRMAEVGCNRGVSTEAFAIHVAEVLAVDCWVPPYTQGEVAFREVAARYPGIRLVREPSPAAAGRVPDGSLDLVYIDAAHDFKSCAADIAAWTPKVRAGGWVTGHDHGGGFSGVIRAVAEAFGGPDRLFSDDSWVVRKV